MARQENDSGRESRRIIERAARDSGVLGRMTAKAQDHFGAADADPDDPVEQWGTRIGRGIALLVSVALICALVVLVLRN